ncbi:hypothetical protein DUNSADRAFT_3499 [Dunaliella salina]|uniref:Uncharacterized protein n=1 Tax=Dunaliella salina TaxID=3046 RepID=A0ABQ7FVB8_DUNSA|nr:hypothetical protein DUNSADRAFT_3499 [Dunaliella salina]|eukprot:KAF5826336.1 hypothetical protein DUNSADRAFT_3499 [Dunaliella salina]
MCAANLVNFGGVKEPTPDEEAKMSKEDRENLEKANDEVQATMICLGPNNIYTLEKMRSTSCSDDEDSDGDLEDSNVGTSPPKAPKRDTKKAKKQSK